MHSHVSAVAHPAAQIELRYKYLRLFGFLSFLVVYLAVLGAQVRRCNCACNCTPWVVGVPPRHCAHATRLPPLSSPQRDATDAQSVTAALLGLVPVGATIGATGDLYSWLAAALTPVYAVRRRTRAARRRAGNTRHRVVPGAKEAGRARLSFCGWLGLGRG